MDEARVDELLSALQRYREARRALLDVLRRPQSNREPLTEWSEHLVAALLDGQLAPTPVHPGYDLTTPDHKRVQVRSLANVSGGGVGAWVNEHRVTSLAGVDRYALVVFEAFKPVAVLVFPNHLAAINRALGKKAPDQESVLQFTRANYLAILADPDKFRQMGMTVWQPPQPN